MATVLGCSEGAAEGHKVGTGLSAKGDRAFETGMIDLECRSGEP
jgi:hypothetical protein